MLSEQKEKLNIQVQTYPDDLDYLELREKRITQELYCVHINTKCARKDSKSCPETLVLDHASQQFSSVSSV